MARGRLGSLTPSAAACDPAACKPVRASIFACLPACICDVVRDENDPCAEPVDLCSFPAADPVVVPTEAIAEPVDLVAPSSAPSSRVARSPLEDAPPAKASRNESPARRLELADESLGWSDDGSGSDSETDEGEYETQGQLAVFDLRDCDAPSEC